MIKWTVSRPREVTEDDKMVAQVEADTIEEALELAAPKLYQTAHPALHQIYAVTARVQVQKAPRVPLKSI